jgi:hypothetical protein
MSHAQDPPWSIGIYRGGSPFEFAPTTEVVNPVLTPADVSEYDAELVADPFMLHSDGTWSMLFETLKSGTRKGDIALATSDDALHWTYGGIVLSEPFHLSYPYVFEWDGDVFMIPETLGLDAVSLYRADPFPSRWTFEAKLIPGLHADPSIVRWDEKWWLFTCPRPNNDTLRLFVADELTGPWREHPRSPVVRGDAAIARPGGRILETEGRLIRYAQDCSESYGRQVRAFEIAKLNEVEYEEREWPGGPVLTASGSGWNRSGMHNIDPKRTEDGGWLACVDGQCW